MRAVLLALLLMLAGAGCRPRATPIVPADAWPDPFLEPTAALMWPGATRSFQIRPDGGLYNGVWSIRFDARCSGRPAGAPLRIAYQDRWLPVARWTEHAGDVRWDFEAVAGPVPRVELPDVVRRAGAWMVSPFVPSDDDAERVMMEGRSQRALDRLAARTPRRLTRNAGENRSIVVSVLATATNEGTRPRDATLAVTFAPADSAQPFFEDGARPAGPLRWGWSGASGDSAIGFVRGPVADGTSRRVWTLPPGGSARVRFGFPTHPMRRDDLSDWMQASHRERVDAASAFWRHEMSRGTTFDLGDAELERAIRGARVVLLSCRERRDGRWVPLGGPFQYRDVELRDGARAIQALAVHGYTREARLMASSLTAWQWPQGPFVGQGAPLDGTGQALWAFEQAFLRPRPARETARYAESAERAVLWCERVRRSPHGVDAAAASMMVPTVDPHAQPMRAPLVGTDAWAIAGYRSASRLLRAAGRTAEAEATAQAWDRYRAAFRVALERTSSPDLPASWNGGGDDNGNLAAAWPCGAISPDDPRVVALARRTWRRTGGPGLGCSGDSLVLHGYVAADLGVAALLAGRHHEADQVLDALVHWRNASGGACEMFRRGTGDYGVNLPPHATSAAALLNLARQAIVYDDDDTLRLTLGARDAWWRRGGSVRGAPTRWGTIDVQFVQYADQARWRFTPVAVWTELTAPPGTRVIACEDGARIRDNRILVPPGVRQVTATITPDARAAAD